MYIRGRWLRQRGARKGDSGTQDTGTVLQEVHSPAPEQREIRPHQNEVTQGDRTGIVSLARQGEVSDRGGDHADQKAAQGRGVSTVKFSFRKTAEVLFFNFFFAEVSALGTPETSRRNRHLKKCRIIHLGRFDYIPQRLKPLNKQNFKFKTILNWRLPCWTVYEGYSKSRGCLLCGHWELRIKSHHHLPIVFEATEVIVLICSRLSVSESKQQRFRNSLLLPLVKCNLQVFTSNNSCAQLMGTQ